MAIKHMDVDMPDMSDRPKPGWAERIIKNIIQGSQTQWIERYKDQRIKDQMSLATDDESLTFNGRLPNGVKVNTPY